MECSNYVKVLLAMLIALILLPVSAFAAKGFDVTAATDAGYNTTIDTEYGITCFDNAYRCQFNTPNGLVNRPSQAFSQIIAFDDGIAALRTWICYVAKRPIGIKAVSFIIENTKYTFDYVDYGENVTKYDGYVVEDMCIVYDNSNRQFLEAVDAAYGQYSYDELDSMTFPLIIHGPSDIRADVNAVMLLDLLVMYDAMEAYGGTYDEDGAPLTIKPITSANISVTPGISMNTSVTTAAPRGESLKVKVGDSLFLGHYEQDNKTENGAEPIKWTVLAIDGDKALVISTNVLDCQPYNTKKGDTTWATCSLRTWLNKDFYQAAFTPAEAALIQSASISNGQADQPKVDKWEGKPGKNTEDKIWLLSYAEVKKYLKATRVEGTEYANSKGAKANIFASESNWYTRSVGKKQDQATFIHDNFDPQTCGTGDKRGIRPVMWISLYADWSSFQYQRSQNAAALARQGKYVEAYQITDALGTYNNSVALSAQYRFDYAKATMNKGDYATAIELFTAYSNFATSKKLKFVSDYDVMMPECYNKLACQNLTTGEHDKATALFTRLGKYDAKKAAGYWFDYATAVMNKGNYAEAIALYQSYKAYAESNKVNLSGEFATYYPDCYNKLARQNLTTGEHDKAMALYIELGQYDATKAAGFWFDYATAVKNNGDLKTTVVLYHSYYEYAHEHSVKLSPEYSTNMPECYYQLAMAAKNSGDYKTAISYFSQMGQYKDVMEQLMACFDKTHTQYRWLTQNNGSVVNAGTKGYAESKPISGDDPHFGWNLGRFMMSGYTEVDDAGSYPVFIKTYGDNLVLWFDLNEDIDKLHGNKDLTIARDTDGFDQAMGYPKTDMGRGALLLKHTDFRNSDGTPVAYLDYLGAKESGVANTLVEVKEEGIYEVALDYEIHDANLMHAFNSTNNYRIAFKFAVKNGSAMFYMFDIGTGAELEDYSRTAEGFRIDFANSHSLKIAVVRYALNQSYTGLDIRSNAPASDGDEFDRTGYYEITIENTETGVKMTKHIFVGNKGDLADYQDADDRLSQFSK